MRVEIERTTTAFTSDVMKDAPAIYAQHFTAQELPDMLAFYKSPTGIKALREMPALTGELAATVMPRLPSFQKELDQRLRIIMQKHGYKE